MAGIFVEDWRLAAGVVAALAVAGLAAGPLASASLGWLDAVLLAGAMVAALLWRLG